MFYREMKMRCLMSLFLLLGCESAVLAQSSGWGQFLGPDRDGISDGTDLLAKWPAQGLDIAWRVDGGVGMSAVAVADGRAITMWNSARGQVVTALSVKDGSVLWTAPVAANYENSMGNGPRATPTIAGQQVFAYTGEGILVSLDVSTGKKQWSKSVVREMAGRPAEYGMSCSPLVVDDIVIVTAGGQGKAVVALDRKSGEVLWTAVDGLPGYSSPALLNLCGELQVVAFTARGVTGLRPSDGNELWSYPFKTPYDCNTATPIEVGGKVFISSGENHGCVMLDVTKQAAVYNVDEAWVSVDVKSVMRNEWQTSILLNGYLYGFDNVGSAGPVTHLTCIEAATGKVAWTKTRFGKGNLVAADGKLWITTMKGEIVLVEATPAGYSELGRQQMFGKTRQNVSIANGFAFIRDDSQVISIKIK
jgi:outer membrane protein assembly factor BamB